MSADRSIRKGSGRTLKAITNQNGRVETILEQRVEWCNINGRCAQEAVTATVKRNVVGLAIAFDSHAYADRIDIIIARAQETKSAVVPPLWASSSHPTNHTL